jgi:hypothetical protein
MRIRRLLGLVIGGSLAAIGCVDDSVTGSSDV